MPRFKVVALHLILCSFGCTLQSTEYTWTATTPGSSLNTSTNWSPTTTPGSGDTANFNSSLTNIDESPTATGNFTVGMFNFTQEASPFTFTFPNHSLTFTGVSFAGIPGVVNNPTISLTTTEALTYQLDLTGTNLNSLGAANISVSSTPSDQVYAITSQVNSSASVLMSTGAFLQVENSATGTTGSSVHIGEISNSQVYISSGIISSQDSVTINLINSGTASGTMTSSNVGYLSTSNGKQLSADALFGGSNCSFTASNTGNNTATGAGNSVGICLGQQVQMANIQLGNYSSFTLTNSGTNNSTASNQLVGYVDIQAEIDGLIAAGDYFSFTLENTGVENSTGAPSENKVGYVIVGQGLMDSFNAGDYTTFTVTNEGTYSGDVSNSFAGYVANYQYYNNNSPFVVGDYLTMLFLNEGTAADNNVTGGNRIGEVGTYQSNLGNFISGNNATITFKNVGTSTVSNTATNDYVGVIGDQQLYIANDFITGDFLVMTVTNEGSLSTSAGPNYAGVIYADQVKVVENFIGGSGCNISFENKGTLTDLSTGGSSYIGYVKGTQFYVQNSLSLGEDSAINVVNEATATVGGFATDDYIAYVGEYQLYSESNISVGDNATINIENTSTGTINASAHTNYLSYLNSGQVEVSEDFLAGSNLLLTVINQGTLTDNATTGLNVASYSGGSQFETTNFTVQDNATVTITNIGSLNSSGNSELVGYIAGNGFHSSGNTYTGDNFNFTATNYGSATGTGGSGNSVGYTGYQALLTNVTLGDNATFTFTNNGVCTDATITGSIIGYIESGQIYVQGIFQAGENLTISATNTTTNPHNISNVGIVEGSQISFASLCILGDGALISAENSGNGLVTGNQIVFGSSFSLLGKATFQAVNTSTNAIGGTGISITSAVGGDLDIILQNSSLNVTNTAINIPFTMSSLTGDSASTATSDKGFIFNPAAGVHAIFEGSVSTSSGMIIKTGAGTQTLSGAVDPAATYVMGGTLDILSTFTGNIDVFSTGTLTGSSTISGTVTNDGLVAPTSTMTITTFTNNSDGTYEAQVSSSSGVYHANVTGTATLNGTALIGTFNNTYQFQTPYTILAAGNPLVGTFSGASGSPLIRPVLSYGTHDVYVTIFPNVSAAANTPNQSAVAGLLDGIVAPSLAQSNLISQITSLSVSEASDALESISGYQYADDPFWIEGINRQFIRRLYDPLRPIVTCNLCNADRCCDPWTVWFEAGGDFTRLNASVLNGVQVTAGFQKRFCPSWTAGIGISYEADFLHYKDNDGRENINSIMVGPYALYRPDHFYVLADIAYGYSASKVKRNINLGNIEYTAQGNPHNSEFTGYAEIGVDLPLKKVLIQPFFGAEVDISWRNGIQETGGGGWELIVNSKDHTDAYTRLGAHLSICDIPYDFTISIDGAWDYRYTSQNNTIQEEYVLLGGPIVVEGSRISRSSADYAVTLSNQFVKNWNFYIETTGQVYSDAQTYTILGGFGFSW